MARWTVVACDYDGTLATLGAVPPAGLAAVAAYRKAGGRLVLVTGRRSEELVEVFPEVRTCCDLVVAENGGVLLEPGTSHVRRLAAPLPGRTASVLEGRGVHDYELGAVLVSAAREDEDAVRLAAADLSPAWPCQVVPNKDRVMLLPADVDKGSGLRAAAAWLGVAVAEVLAIGDGENDLPLLAAAGWGVAVSDAVPALLAAAQQVTLGEASQGVIEVLRGLLQE